MKKQKAPEITNDNINFITIIQNKEKLTSWMQKF